MRSNSEEELVAVIRFRRCVATVFSVAGSEDFDLQPLSQCGVDSGSAYILVNSEKVEEISRIHRVKNGDRADVVRPFKHYILAFDESIFECIAESFDFRVCRGSVNYVLACILDNAKGTRDGKEEKGASLINNQ